MLKCAEILKFNHTKNTDHCICLKGITFLFSTFTEIWSSTKYVLIFVTLNSVVMEEINLEVSCSCGGCISSMKRENIGSVHRGLHGGPVVSMSLEDWAVVWKLG